MRQTPALRRDFGDNSECSSSPCMHVQGTVQAVLRSRRSASDEGGAVGHLGYCSRGMFDSLRHVCA